MAKKWFWTSALISFLYIFWLSGPKTALAFQPNQKQKLLLEKKHKKIERRIEKNEERKNEYFSKKRTLLIKKYYLKLRRLENKKNKIPERQYVKIYRHLQKWFDYELRQLAYQEKKFRKKLAQHKEQLNRLQ
jgi:hypothetical protein